MITTSNRKGDGTAGRDAAIELLESRRQVYVNRGRRALLLRLLTGESATADDVRAAVELPESIDPVCLGAVPGSLARAGIITRAGFVATARPNAHARPVSIWALANRDAAVAWLRGHPDKPDPMPDEEERRRQLTLPGVA
ncbi:MAG: hypothetical protein O3C40_21310 [Planctomycetota bacterium]|nr:hypothetical protein [Planctomycetota bacterium]